MGGRCSKKQIQEFYKRKTRKARLLGDAERLKDLKNLLDNTGGGKGLSPFVPTPADEVETGGVDPRLLTARDPLTDKYIHCRKCYRGCLLLQCR
jgi:hypothetical protein